MRSAGGKQGRKEAEMFPDDFDGIVARAPAWWTTHMQLWNVIVGMWNAPSIHRIIFRNLCSFSLLMKLPNSVMLKSGVKDGILMDPHGRTFRPKKIFCASNAANVTTCLKKDQIKNLGKAYTTTGWNKQYIHLPIISYGYRIWLEPIPSPSPLGTIYVQHMLGLGSNWTYQDWNPDIIALPDKMNRGNATADHFDLSPFYSKGGKLLRYHRLSDWSITT